MTTKADYTTEEWNQLLQSPLQAGFYVSQLHGRVQRNESHV